MWDDRKTGADDYPQRKPNRLANLHYNENGTYFITICTRNKANLFWLANTHEPHVGAALRRPPFNDPQSHNPTNLRKPHVGAALRRPPFNDPQSRNPTDLRKPHVGAALRRPPEPLNANGHIVQCEINKFDAIYQGIVTVDNFVIMPNHVHLLLSIHSERLGGRRNAAPTISSVVNQFKGSVTKAVGSPCWQKSFHDHIVRDEAEYLKIWEYIDANPGKWTEDRYFIPLDDNPM